MTDPYDSGDCRWWHLSEPSPELAAAIADGWISPPGPIVDLGCGLGVEATHLAASGFVAIGLDLSISALQRARRGPTSACFVQADARHIPFAAASVRFLLDRGCFHYLAPEARRAYEHEARRVLTPGGRLLLRACLTAAGIRNDIDEEMLRQTFASWRFARLDHKWLASDTRTMEALVARLEIR